MQWWCAAQGTAWTWSWRPYPGVWLVVLIVLVSYLWLVRRPNAGPTRRWAGLAGVFLLWAGLDWPIGALGAGYLASVHMLQYLLIALAAPALLLLGVPRGFWLSPAAGRFRGPSARAITHPLTALAAFNLVLFATHLPNVVDTLMRSQAGSFMIDMLWFLAGLLFWWPVLVPVPERPRFAHPMKMGYLFLNSVLATLPYAFLTFGELPFYAVYELAPPVGNITAREDQQMAGLLMKVGGGVIMWTAITILFFRWFRREEEAEARGAG